MFKLLTTKRFFNKVQKETKLGKERMISKYIEQSKNSILSASRKGKNETSVYFGTINDECVLLIIDYLTNEGFKAEKQKCTHGDIKINIKW